MNAEPHDVNVPQPPRGAGFLLYFGGAVLVALLVVGSLALSAGRRKAEASEAAARQDELRSGPLVETGRVRKLPPGRTLTVSGEVHAYRQATLYAKVSGYLKMIRVDKGDRVKSGEILGVIEAPEVEQEVASKQADLALKKLTDARYKALAQSGVVSVQERERAEADVRIATADLSRLNALRGYEVIRAPYSGVITARHADPGALLQAATSSQAALSLVDVADIDRVRVFVYLGQGEALFVHEGDAVTLWTDQLPDKKVQAKVTRFTRQLDPRTRTMLTEVEVDNREAGFYPGTFVRVALTLATPESLAVPLDALVYRGGDTFVARVADDHATLVKVELGDTDGKTVRVRGPIADGEVVVLHPGDEVADGARVRVAATPTRS